MKTRKLESCLLTLSVAALAACLAPAGAAAVTVYKCFDRNLGVLYTDQPCRGEQLAIEAGRGDPDAIAELAREREALSRAVAQRIADHRRYAAAVPEYVLPPPPPPGPEIYYPAGLGYYAPYGQNRAHGRGGNFGSRDHGRAPAARSVPAVPPNGITNRTFR
jgi:hypothetical protein